MNKLVKLVVYHLSKINNRPLLNLYFTLSIQLQSCCMDKAHISNVELTTNCNNHKLSFPELLIIRDVVVTSLAFTDFEDGSITFTFDLQALEFFGIGLVKLEN